MISGKLSTILRITAVSDFHNACFFYVSKYFWECHLLLDTSVAMNPIDIHSYVMHGLKNGIQFTWTYQELN